MTIIFQEPGALPFTPKNIRSHFQHVFIIVRVHKPCTDSVCYRYAPAPYPCMHRRPQKLVSSIRAACGREREWGQLAAEREWGDSWPRCAASCVSCLCFSRGALFTPSHTF